MNGTRQHYISIGSIGPQCSNTKSKFVAFAYEIPNLPDSNYAPAKLHPRDVEIGIGKYFNEVLHWTEDKIYSDVCLKLQLPTTPAVLRDEVFSLFSKHLPGINIYTSRELPFEKILRYMTHDLSGHLRRKTSAGIGFKHDRKYIARNFQNDVRSCYDLTNLDFDIYWKIFLKDELREVSKDTRSIAVPQLHLWIVGMKYLGGLYEWFADYLPSWSGYGLSDQCSDWAEKFVEFDPAAVTYGYDLRKQDSRMSPGFILFLERYIKSITPVSHWFAIEWFFDQSFHSKKVVDMMGHVLTFSQGEMSGNPFTILINTLHNLYTHVLHLVAAKYKNLITYDLNENMLGEVFCILGDDTIMQTQSPDLYREICLILGHETTSEVGKLFDDVTFLSMKITSYKCTIASYYCNLDKMFSSLLYTTNGEEEYFQKLCSYYRQLIFAPKGSAEKEWKSYIEAHIYYLIQINIVDPTYYSCFSPSHIIKRERLGLTYHGSSVGCCGRVENKVFTSCVKWPYLKD